MSFRDRPNADRAFLLAVQKQREADRERLVETADLEPPAPKSGGREADPVRDAELRRLHALGKTDAEIAAAIGVTPNGIHSMRRRLGLEVNAVDRKAMPKWSYRRIRALIDAGWTDVSVARETRTPVEVVSKARARAGKRRSA